MNLKENPTIRELAATNPTLMPFFTPIERAIIEICIKVVQESGGEQCGK